MNYPRDCTECKYTKTCKSYYGGSMCKHASKINADTIARTLGKEAHK